MKLVAATLYALRIPFVESFSHSARERRWSDSVVVRVRDDAGAEGFGEGSPRPYVTGETVESMLDHLASELWPRVAHREVPPADDLEAVDLWLPETHIAGALAPHASRAAFEMAVLDCTLRRAGRPHIKLKVGFEDDVARVTLVREALGPEASLRLDANGAWTFERAVEVLTAVAHLGIAAVEQPLPRGPVEGLARLRQAVPVPIMVDESLVTRTDAEALIAARAADFFNVRVSKCGGIARSRALASAALAARVGVQVGSQVGETAILSAAGRHLAAALPAVEFVEGSFGTLLLAEDVSLESVRFGYRGEAPILTGPGLGIRVVEERLRRRAVTVRELTAEG
jgi:L-alanine-DL-glutamate epimerase-like enolase superfamily enzyme